MSRGAKVLLIVLLCGAVTANYFRLPLYSKLDMLFGSIFTMIIIQLFGFRLGLLSAVLSGAFSWFVFNHHFSGINFICEAAVVGYLLHRRGKELVFLSAMYWILIGMPMAYAYFTFFRPLENDMALLIMFKQGTNGIFNTLAAKMIVTLLPLSQRLSEITQRRQVSFRQIISTTLAACVLFPLLTLTILSIREEFNDEMTDLSSRELSHVAYHTQGVIQAWLNERFSDITSLEQLQSNAAFTRERQKNIEQINKLDRNILQIGLIDQHGLSIAFDPPVNRVTGLSNIGVRFADAAKLQAMNAVRKPIISGVMVGGSAEQSPVVVVDAPIVAADRFEGYVTGVLSLQGLRGLLSQIAKDWSCKAVLLDKERRIIVGSEPTWKTLEPFTMNNGEAVAINATTSQWIPKVQGASGAERWRQSYYIKEMPIGLGTSWRLVLALPLQPRLHSLNKLFTKELFFMMVIILPTLGCAHLIGKRLVLSLNRLQAATTGLPDIVSRQMQVKWPSSFISEISSLIANFQSVTASLSEKFGELSTSNRELFRENRERRSAEEKLGQATSELTAIFQAFPDRCLVADADTTIFDCKGGKMEDLSPWIDGVQGKRLSDAFPPEIAEEFRGSILQVLNTCAMVTFEFHLPGESGDSCFETRLVPLSREQVVIFVRNITDLKKAEELRVSNEQLRNLSIHLEEVRENERALIAREIHDELGQQLTGLRFDLGWVGKRLPTAESELSGRIGAMAQLVDRTIKTVRRIALELRPRMLDDLGLVAAMEWQVSEFQQRTAIPCLFRVSNNELVVEQRRATAIFRILQEALTNIIRHAQATRVEVFLSESNGMLVLKIVDNGKGISKNEVRGKASFGIMGMHERAREWGGSVTFTGQPGHGTNILVAIPLGKKGED